MAFKLSVITDEVSQDLETVAKFAERFRLDGIEIRTVWNRSPQDLLGRVDEIKKILRKYGLTVSAIASPFFKSEIESEEEYQKHLKILENCICLAKSLDTEIIRGFTFWRRGSLDEYMERILEKFQRPLEIIESEGVTLGIENEPSTFVGNGKELSVFLDRLGSENVQAIWDPGNDIFDPEGETPYPDGYEHVKDRIIHVHVKDGIRRGSEGKPECVAIGEGEVDYPGQLRALKQDGYCGFLSLETHWRPGKQLSEDLISKPGGEEFSSLGEYASEICMRNLQKMLSGL
jgi:sugar phosphate isomerase/epimerase